MNARRPQEIQHERQEAPAGPKLSARKLQEASQNELTQKPPGAVGSCQELPRAAGSCREPSGASQETAGSRQEPPGRLRSCQELTQKPGAVGSRAEPPGAVGRSRHEPGEPPGAVRSRQGAARSGRELPGAVMSKESRQEPGSRQEPPGRLGSCQEFTKPPGAVGSRQEPGAAREPLGAVRSSPRSRRELSGAARSIENRALRAGTMIPPPTVGPLWGSEIQPELRYWREATQNLRQKVPNERQEASGDPT